jgi:hypothetical protein
VVRQSVRHVTAFLILTGLIASACVDPAPNGGVPSEAVPTAGDGATAVPSLSAARCRDAAPPIRTTTAAATDDLSRIPGRALFWDAGVLRLLEGGRVRELRSPYLVREWNSKVTTDGRVVALLGGEHPGDAHLWSQSSGGAERLVKMPVAVGTGDLIAWSPRAQRVHWITFRGQDAWIVGLDGGSHRATFPGHVVFAAAWRSEDELTLVSALPTNTAWPIVDATLWSWRPPALPTRFAGSVSLAVWPRWSPDGRLLATVESVPEGRVVVLRGDASRTIVTERDLAAGPNNCVREVSFTGVSWSPDGGTLAVLGRGTGYFAAFVPIGSSSPAVMFAAPVGEATCYIPGRVDWYGTSAVVPLFGPDCGPNAAGAENALAVVDPSNGNTRYVTISRKGFLALSGGWAVAASGTREMTTEFISLDGQVRVNAALWRLVDYCCVD